MDLLIKYDTLQQMDEHPNNPLQGKTLETILTFLVDQYGWETLGDRIKINCFVSNPSIKSSLIFLRRTPWAREKVESLYIETVYKNPIRRRIYE